MHFSSIKTKMTCAVFLLVLLLACATAVFSLLYYERNIKESLSTQQFAMATAMAEDLDDKLAIVQNALKTSKGLITREIINNPDRAQRFLDSQVSLLSMYDNGLYLFSRDGKIIAESPYLPGRRGRDISFREWYRQTMATKKPYLSTPYISTHSPGHPAIIFTVPITDVRGELVAILSGSFDLLGKNILQDFASTKIGKTGYVYLCDNNRTIIIHPDSRRIMAQAAPIGGNRLFDKAMAGFEGSEETTTSYGITALASFKRLHTTNWIIAINYPLSEAYAPIHRARTYFLFGGIAAALLSALLVWAVMSYLTAPLLSFTEHIKNIAGREGKQKLVSIGANDEIGSLARAFNSMLTELDKQKLDLNNQVQFLQILMDTIPTAIYYQDPNGRFLGCNTAFEAMHGLPREQIIGRTAYDFLPKEFADNHYQEDLQILSLRDHRFYESSVLVQNRKMTDVILYKSAFSNADGTLGGIVGAILDISERKLAEETLRGSEELYRSLVDNIDMGITLVDDQFRILMVNPAAEKLVSKAASELLQQQCFEQFEGDSASCGNCPGKIAMETGRRATAENLVLRNNSTRVLKVHAIPVLGPDRKPAKFIEVVEDITEQKQAESDKKTLEDQLRHSQKMEAIGQLAGGVAHDFNNILSVIMGYGYILKAGTNLGESQRENLDQIITAAEKAAQLTGGLLAFSRKQVITPQIVSLNNLLVNLQKFLVRVIGEDVHLKTILNEADLLVNVDSGQIEQLLINLATNARDAMPQGGVLTIETGFQEIDAAFARLHGDCQAGSYAVIAVADTGAGMSTETRKRIFEPFYTTKEIGKGTGLGMAIVYGIVKQHNGIITLSSEPERGAIFRIFLPLITVKADAPQELTVLSLPKGCNETILVAEDEPAVSKLVESILTGHGYEVILAGDGKEVVAKFMTNRDRIKLVLMDIIMPQQNGKAAADEIRQLQPDVKILFSSGYTADFIRNRGVEEEGMELIMKPYQPLELLRNVREMLGDR
jgi:PAS domain S-box-containing protein